MSAYYDADGVFHSGYWMPMVEEVGFVWVPGWFDGNAWTDGYWVRENDYAQEDVEHWQPESGWNDGWEVGSGWGDGEVIEPSGTGPGPAPEWVDDAPLALPVEMNP